MAGKTDFEIEKVILRRVSIPMHEPFRIANGEVSNKESVIIEIYSKESIGYGEASPMPGSFYSADTPDSVWNVLKSDLVPDLLSRTIQSPVDYAKSLETYKQAPFARAGMEGAMWHHEANRLKTSITQLFGVKPEPIASGAAIGLYDTVEELMERVHQYHNEGYQRIKIKIKPGWDIEPLAAIRNKFPNLHLMVDANASYIYEEHRKILLALDRFKLLMIEQPLAAEELGRSAELQSEITTPICMDESAETMLDLLEIIQRGAAKIVNIKVQRVGGLWNAKQMHDQAHQAGLDCWVGTMPELGIASAQALSIANLPGFTYPTDIEASDRWYKDDIITPKITIDPSGFIHVPKTTGMGYEVDTQKLEQYTTSIETFVR